MAVQPIRSRQVAVWGGCEGLGQLVPVIVGGVHMCDDDVLVSRALQPAAQHFRVLTLAKSSKSSSLNLKHLTGRLCCCGL